MLFGVWPRNGASAPATAVFPLDIYFDLKQSISFATGWGWAFVWMAVAVALRAACFSSTLWLADGAKGSFLVAWLRTLRFAGVAVAALIPCAAFMYTGTAIRYAPFIWIGGLLGFIPATLLLRRAVSLDVGAGAPVGRGVPEVAAFLGYAYLVALLAAAMSVLGGVGAWAVSLLILCAGPIHILYLLGWREHLKLETYPGGGALAIGVTVLALALFGYAVAYDRYITNPPPVGRTSAIGALLLLGGADSTLETGALLAIDPRDLGFPRSRSTVLSYRTERRYAASDTRGDLSEIAVRVAVQIANLDPPRFVLGHSQAALILDRMEAGRLGIGERVAVISPSPTRPPTLEAPPPGESGIGKPGADLARALSAGLELVGFQGFDIDAESSPVQLDEVTPQRRSVPRLAVWALGDSVWLDQDWRRNGEINVISLSDHVGATTNTRSLDTVRRFFTGRRIEGDETSWRGLLVSMFRYAFEPWRPR